MQEKQSRNKVVASALQMLRRVKTLAQLSPFVYALGYIIILFLYNRASGLVLDVLDDLFYVSPLVIVTNLLYSRILKFCIWHKIACLLPIIPEIANLSEALSISLYVEQAAFVNYSAIATSALFLISAYKVFICNGS